VAIEAQKAQNIKECHSVATIQDVTRVLEVGHLLLSVLTPEERQELKKFFVPNTLVIGLEK
jgi:hypothetical protein